MDFVAVQVVSVTGSSSALRNWIERDMLRRVVVTSPHPPQECLRRLAKVTTGRKSDWHLDWRTAALPDPLFHGEVGPSGVRIALFTEVTTGGPGTGVRAWFDARVDPAPEGGTVLAGTVGSPSARARAVLSLAFIVFWAGMALFSLVAGAVIAATGHFNTGVGAAIALPVIVTFAILASRGKNGLEAAEDPIPRLLRKIDGVLDATSAFPGPNPVL